jgi:predicted HTH transcriptional regulator
MTLRDDYKFLTADTKRLLDGQEGRYIDFKVKPDGVKAEDFVALANAKGGTILVGVDEPADKRAKQHGVVVGCSINDKTRLSFTNMAASCRPAIDINIRVENSGTKKPIYRIDIPEGKDKPYCTSAGLYKIRVDGQNVAIDPPLMKAIILDQEASEFVERFKSAGDELLKKLDLVHKELGKQITRVEEAADEAAHAANMAEQAARDAEQAAVEAGLWAGG